MKILIVMWGFFPGRNLGGPPVSVDNFCSLMGNKVECFIVTHNHDKDDSIPYEKIKSGWNDHGNAKVMYLSDREYCYSTFLIIAKKINPDYLYLQSLFQSCAIPCLFLANKLGIKVVLAPRGELCSGAFNKKYKKLPYIAALRMTRLLRNVEFQSTSDEETEAIKKYLGAEIEHIHLLTNIPSIPHDLPKRNEKLPGEGRFVFISRIVRKKNLISAINCFREVKGRVTFDVYGPKEDETYWYECEQAIGKLSFNVTVSYKGVLTHDEIHRTFCQYDAFLFPTFSENYGHVIAEALLTGCIPIISDQTPWTDMNEAGAGWAISLNNKEVFKNAIQEIIDMDEEDMKKMRSRIEGYTSNKLQIEQLKMDYLKVFQTRE